jgi:ferredoxin
MPSVTAAAGCGRRRERPAPGRLARLPGPGGLWHEVAPDLIDLDEWGYPLVRGPVPPHLRADAREAVRVCPRLALRLLPGR